MAGKLPNLIGNKYFRLTVLKSVKNKRGLNVWLCKCDCGKEVTASTQALKEGRSKSCGCYKKEITVARLTTHNMSNSHAEYKAWEHMLYRCLNQNCKTWQYYGGRGITVSDSWLDFSNFINDMGLKPSKEHELERIDNDGNYCKENCCWATRKEQVRNTRRNVNLTFQGVTMCLTDWSHITGIPLSTLQQRIDYGWSVEDALLEPINVKFRKWRK